MEKTLFTSNPQFTSRTTGVLMPCKRPGLYSKQNGSSAATFPRCANMIAASNISRPYQHFLVVPVMDSLFEQIHLSRTAFLIRLHSRRIWNLDIDLPSAKYRSPC